MIKPKFKLVREFDQAFDTRRLINEMVSRIKGNYRNVDIFDDNIGFGFLISTGKPKTLKNMLYKENYLFSSAPKERVNTIKNIING